MPSQANGPEDVIPKWEAIDWRFHEGNVRRLRRRIFKAGQGGEAVELTHPHPTAGKHLAASETELAIDAVSQSTVKPCRALVL